MNAPRRDSRHLSPDLPSRRLTARVERFDTTADWIAAGLITDTRDEDAAMTDDTPIQTYLANRARLQRIADREMLEEQRAGLARLERWEATVGWGSDEDGVCRHGTYVGGSGWDRMCGTCEQYDLGSEMEMLRGLIAHEEARLGH